MLNAFRHHGVYQIEQDGSLGPFLCSTPFGITEYISPAEAAPPRASRPVLNAFRHHGVYQPTDALARPRRNVVLNAFRHHGVYQLGCTNPAPHGFFLCSTPFGITEYISATRAATRSAPANSAQRLSASRSISGSEAEPASPAVWSGAQRLSASRSISVSASWS